MTINNNHNLQPPHVSPHNVTTCHHLPAYQIMDSPPRSVSPGRSIAASRLNHESAGQTNPERLNHESAGQTNSERLNQDAADQTMYVCVYVSYDYYLLIFIINNN